MKVSEVEALLKLIESYDRRPFSPAAVDLWHGALGSLVTLQDATDAVHSIFRMNPRDERTGQLRTLIPNDVLRPAQAIGEARRRAVARVAIEAPRVRRGSTGRPAAVEELLAEARRKAQAAAERRYAPTAA